MSLPQGRGRDLSTKVLTGPFQKRRNAMAATALEVVAPALRGFARVWTGHATDPREWRRGLLLGADHLGDVLYRTSSLRALQDALPNCEWDWLLDGASAELVAHHPVIRRTVPRAALAGNRGAWDVALCYDPSSYARSLLESIRLKVPNRIGYTHRGLSAWVTHPLPVPARASYPAVFARAVAALGATPRPEPLNLRPEVVTTERDEEEAESFMRSHGLPEAGGWCATFLTSRQKSGVWPARYLADALAALEQEKPELPTILLGAPGDEPVLMAEKARAKLRAKVAAGTLRVRALVCLLRRAGVVLSTDSGPRHLANAAGVPVVFFRNISFGTAEAGRYLDSECDLAPPELEFVTPERQAAAFARVTPAQATAAVLSRLSR